MNTFKTGAYDLPYSVGVLAVADNAKYLNNIMTRRPLQMLAEKNTIKYRIDFNDTKLAGKSVIKIDDINDIDNFRAVQKTLDIENIQKIKNYTFEDGEFNYFKVALAKSIWEEIETISDGAGKRSLYNIESFIYPNVYSKPIDNIIRGNDDLSFSYLIYYNDLNEDYQFWKIKVFDTELELQSSDYDRDFIFCFAKDTEKVYYYDIDDGYIEAVTPISYGVINRKDNILTTDSYRALKDRSEIIGLDMIIPLL